MVKPSEMAAVALFRLLCLDKREKVDEYFMIQSAAWGLHFTVPCDCKHHYGASILLCPVAAAKRSRK
jgi:hypothetical protein